MESRTLIRATIFLGAALGLCLSASAPAARAETVRVVAGVPPVAFLAERLGGELVEVDVLLSASRDPHTFEPTPRQVSALGSARLFLTAGLPFEERLAERMDHPDGPEVVDVSRGIARLDLPGHPGDGRAEPDPHVWLSPPLLKEMARNTAAALIDADPGHGTELRRNLDVFNQAVDSLHQRVSALLAPHAGRSFFVYHPAFGHFAAAYGLRQAAVETGGSSPSPRQLSLLIDQARAEGVPVIFVQPQFDPRSAAVIARAIGGSVVPVDPLARDVLENIQAIADLMVEAFGG